MKKLILTLVIGMFIVGCGDKEGGPYPESSNIPRVKSETVEYKIHDAVVSVSSTYYNYTGTLRSPMYGQLETYVTCNGKVHMIHEDAMKRSEMLKRNDKVRLLVTYRTRHISDGTSTTNAINRKLVRD